MKILLLKPISPVYYVIQPDIGLGILSAIIEKNGHDVRILDSGKEGARWDDFVSLIKEERFDIVGIKMFTHEILAVREHVDLIKEHSPCTTVIIGGPHISGDPKGTLQFLNKADIGFAGEAEKGMARFLEIDKDSRSDPALLRTIPNLVWRENGKVTVNPREHIEDPDRIDFPAWHLMKPADYPTAPHGSFCKQTPVAPIIVSRGCPFQCTFCAGHTVTGRRIRYRSPKNVIDEISLLHQEYGVREIHIEDDNFTMKPQFVIDFCNEMIDRDMGLSFALPNGIRLDTLHEELLTLMERAGFYSMALGIESGSNQILHAMKKKETVEVIEEKINLIKKCTSIKLTGFFLLGYPGETEEDIHKTISFSRSLKLDKASFMSVMPLPGTELWDIYRKDGKEMKWESFFYYRTVPGLSDVPPETLRKLQRKAIFGFYLRPRIILGLLGEIRTFNQLTILARRLLVLCGPAAP